MQLDLLRTGFREGKSNVFVFFPNENILSREIRLDLELVT